MTKEFGICGEIGGGGELAPTSLDFQLVQDVGSAHAARVETVFGGQLTADVTSTTLTEVLNITGKGYFSYAALVNTAGNIVASPKIRIIIDGITVLDASPGTMAAAEHIAIVGLFGDQTVLNMSTELIIHFKESFVVSIAGDNTDGVKFGYKRVLT